MPTLGFLKKKKWTRDHASTTSTSSEHNSNTNTPPPSATPRSVDTVPSGASSTAGGQQTPQQTPQHLPASHNYNNNNIANNAANPPTPPATAPATSTANSTAPSINHGSASVPPTQAPSSPPLPIESSPSSLPSLGAGTTTATTTATAPTSSTTPPPCPCGTHATFGPYNPEHQQYNYQHPQHPNQSIPPPHPHPHHHHHHQSPPPHPPHPHPHSHPYGPYDHSQYPQYPPPHHHHASYPPYPQPPYPPYHHQYGPATSALDGSRIAVPQHDSMNPAAVYSPPYNNPGVPGQQQQQQQQQPQPHHASHPSHNSQHNLPSINSLIGSQQQQSPLPQSGQSPPQQQQQQQSGQQPQHEGAPYGQDYASLNKPYPSDPRYAQSASPGGTSLYPPPQHHYQQQQPQQPPQQQPSQQTFPQQAPSPQQPAQQPQQQTAQQQQPQQPQQPQPQQTLAPQRAMNSSTPTPELRQPSPAPAPQPEPTTVRVTKGKYSLGDFDIQQTLGTGSFGRVHLVQSKHNQRFYAVKVLKKAQVVKMKQVEHTNDERRMLGEVKHPFLITLWGTFQDSKNLYMVMDFVEGGELFSLLRKSGRFPNPVAKFYAAEVTLALEYLHSKNIIYRDLKPENLLLDRHGHLKITDFGFAKRVPDKTWTLCGTPDYLAPEVVSNKGYNKSVDWWSLGILIYEMLCGYTPFWDSGSPMKIYENILKGRVKYPPYINPDAHDLLERLITADLTKRLGNLFGGPADVKNHAWFAEVTWDRLSRKDIDAPYTPPVRAGAGDASQFDRYPEEQERYGQGGHDEFGELFVDF